MVGPYMASSLRFAEEPKVRRGYGESFAHLCYVSATAVSPEGASDKFFLHRTGVWYRAALADQGRSSAYYEDEGEAQRVLESVHPFVTIELGLANSMPDV